MSSHFLHYRPLRDVLGDVSTVLLRSMVRFCGLFTLRATSRARLSSVSGVALRLRAKRDRSRRAAGTSIFSARVKEAGPVVTGGLSGAGSPGWTLRPSRTSMMCCSISSPSMNASMSASCAMRSAASTAMIFLLLSLSSPTMPRRPGSLPRREARRPCAWVQ